MIKEIGEPAMLEMLAEELVECAHEALKLARVQRRENPTEERFESDVRSREPMQCGSEPIPKIERVEE